MAKGFKISDRDLMWWVFRPTRDSEMADVVWQAHLEDLELSIIGGANSRDPLGQRLVAAYSSEAEATERGQRLLDAMAATPPKDCRACDGTGKV